MPISASKLTEYLYCPRAVYLGEVLGFETEPTKEQEAGILGHAIRKELSLRQARILKRIKEPEELENRLESELKKILLELPVIYKEKLGEIDIAETLPQIEDEIAEELKRLTKSLEGMMSEMGIQEALTYLTPWKVEYSMLSSELEISGRVDKIYREPDIRPSDIKTGEPPEDGIWEGDRLQVAAYALLIEDRFEEPVNHGYVEYSRTAERRPLIVTEKLRRQVLYTRDAVLDIIEGIEVPDVCPHGQTNKCKNCGHREKCYEV